MEGAAALGGGGEGGIHRLPEECISYVLSLSSPRDACRSAAVSWTFPPAAKSDVVWEKFLPPDYREIISRAAVPVRYSSKRELYFRLCGSILIDGGGKSFALERSTGRKCLMLSARELAIAWGDTPRYWKWASLPESRFSKVAELWQVASVKLGAHASKQAVRLRAEEREPRCNLPRARGDGWMEIEMGEFFNENGDDGEVKMRLKEIKALHWKRGLIVEGIEVRPRT